MKKAEIKMLAVFAVCVTGAYLGTPLFAQDLSAPLDENSMFGNESGLVKVLDTTAASAGNVELVKDTKTYPVFIVEGDVNAGAVGDYVPYGASASDAQTLFGAVNLESLSITMAPNKDLTFNVTGGATLMSNTARDVSLSAYADMRASEYTRFYAASSYKYNITTDANKVVTTKEGFSLDELFVDTAINRKFFFRLGKQKVSWGVGYWYKPADVLSLAQIDPDDPTADREGPFAFKADMPFGKLNHATLYTVPSTNGDGQFSLAERTDIVVGNYELSFAGFARTDMESKPRLMFMFSGDLGPFDVYGENVAAWGSDRTYVRASTSTASGYETYTVDNQLVFQSTVGIKYQYQNADGFSASFQVQGYYNGTGYADSSILQIDAARKAITDNENHKSNDLVETGMYYLAGNFSIGTRFGEGKRLTNTTLSGYALYNFSDNSTRFKPSWELAIGSGGSGLDLELSALTSIGNALSEYAPKGNMVTPELSMTILNSVVASVSAPLRLNSDFSLKKANLNFSLYWDVVSFKK